MLVTIIFFFLRIIAFALGFTIVVATFISALRTFVLPRSASGLISKAVFIFVRYCFDLRMKTQQTFAARDRSLELYAPTTLIAILVAWLLCIQVGYMFMYWAVDMQAWYALFKISGSSLLTLGFILIDNLPTTILVFSQATIGLILIAMLISYLPTIYTAFARREEA